MFCGNEFSMLELYPDPGVGKWKSRWEEEILSLAGLNYSDIQSRQKRCLYRKQKSRRKREYCRR